MSGLRGTVWRMSAPATGPLLLLDGASLWFRAFYAIPEKITAADGQPVNAVRGFTDMVAALVKQHSPAASWSAWTWIGGRRSASI